MEPPSLFKYYHPAKNVHRILQGRTLRFTPPGDLNDPFDCLPYFQDNEDDLKGLRNDKRPSTSPWSWQAISIGREGG